MDEYTLYIASIAAGVLCIGSAIVGGGLSSSVVSIPVLSRQRQVLLAIFGLVIAVGGVIGLRMMPVASDTPAEGAATTEAAPEPGTSTEARTEASK